jgi:ApbE superfamily uncharacterized protein (UPF0280 family)
MTSACAPDVLRGRRVLVVEDQYLIAEEMRRAVERLGGRVVGPVASVEGALSVAVEEGSISPCSMSMCAGRRSIPQRTS